MTEPESQVTNRGCPGLQVPDPDWHPAWIGSVSGRSVLGERGRLADRVHPLLSDHVGDRTPECHPPIIATAADPGRLKEQGHGSAKGL
jgi:hypothetical protein